MLTVYVVPENLIDLAWQPTAQSMNLLLSDSVVSERFSFGDTYGDQEESEERQLRELLRSPLAHIVPAAQGHALPAPAAIKIENSHLDKTQSALCDGPWQVYFDADMGIFDGLSDAIELALEEGASLLIIRT